MLKKVVQELLDEGFKERKDLFLIDLSISSGNDIKVIIDGDKGVLVEDCIFISRAIEHNLDREEHDFSLEVTSAGATSPLTIARQFKKNLGRTLEVNTVDQGKIIADLVKVQDDSIILKWKAREPKPVGKGKITVEKQKELAFNDIAEAKVKIKF
ncbi:MAG: ribosome assembly cofactor RimP [Bacteroidia bacterium]|nr:ribosome assembly cofactor RimP [Bacteroidia bacterium]NND12223.1 ribosome assembly cofactor RimP [Flavobacteriaceae bacterium]NNK28646.1 ribosome assembly cofactor RimP [Flavobacteriaceae bacterium]NNL60988.1 ribosome assembly cofactor RimP [Flavobacteriaceae bacterium]